MAAIGCPRYDGGDPVEPKGAGLAGPVVVTGHVPAAGVEDQAVAVQFAFGLVALPGAVAQGDPAAVADRGGQGQHGPARGCRRRTFGEGEAQGLLQRADLFP